ncbi:UPF0302 protein YpiB [Polycladomyces abyssicola]|jgi:uncharacterized protein YpiB (UPF0302 family)|uniref:UPF0302 protein YpiB n=1 Tax=Polycladomyces abyssicola TaxID=1125966 RepID=A0A8D5UH37_9BACL|nr:ReoY family proteolytic degradation factor [Polycladomyces abyssicola]BCU81805.1 UPF0302 protein YpiB [Polycladomyces abyssicola]
MSDCVTASEKKEFIEWFLTHYELQKREASWLLCYLSSEERLLQRVHFVDNLRGLPKTLLISTRCSQMPAFRFQKNRRVHTDVETAFYDIRSYPDEEIYIGLSFKGRATCPEYAAVLEGNPMEKPDLVQEPMLSLMAEMILDKAVQEFQKKHLYRQIDQALAEGNKAAFLQLTEEWKNLLEFNR